MKPICHYVEVFILFIRPPIESCIRKLSIKYYVFLSRKLFNQTVSNHDVVWVSTDPSYS